MVKYHPSSNTLISTEQWGGVPNKYIYIYRTSTLSPLIVSRSLCSLPIKGHTCECACVYICIHIHTIVSNMYILMSAHFINLGKATRLCNSMGEWEEPNVLSCESVRISLIQAQVCYR